MFRWGLGRNPKGIYPLRLGRWFENENFVYSVNIICYQGVKERMEPKECMKSCVVTRIFLPHPITEGKAIMDNLTSPPSDKLEAILS